jgi:CDP-diacylglycerol--glycerol-3-phosphate 3-phosphatidyltransferase
MKLGWANRVTIVRIALIVPFVYCLISASGDDGNVKMRYVATTIFFLMCLSDFADGHLARLHNDITKLGEFLDPLADKLLMLFACIILAIGPTAVAGFRLPPVVAVVIIGKDLAILWNVIRCYLSLKTVHVDTIMFGKITAVFQLVMIGCILIGPEVSQTLVWWSDFVHILFWAVPVMAVIAAYVNIHRGTLYARECLRKRQEAAVSE